MGEDTRYARLRKVSRPKRCVNKKRIKSERAMVETISTVHTKRAILICSWIRSKNKTQNERVWTWWRTQTKRAFIYDSDLVPLFTVRLITTKIRMTTQHNSYHITLHSVIQSSVPPKPPMMIPMPTTTSATLHCGSGSRSQHFIQYQRTNKEI